MYVRRPHLLVLAALAALVGPVGCPGSLEDPDRFLDGSTGSATCPTGYDVEKDLFQSSCTSASCHDSNAPEGDLDLTGDSFNTMLDTTSVCTSSKKLIDSANPAQSFLLEKLKSNPSCGVRMPSGADALGADKIDCVEKWINSKLGVGGSGGSSGAGGSGGGDASVGGSAGASGSGGASDAGAE